MGQNMTNSENSEISETEMKTVICERKQLFNFEWKNCLLEGNNNRFVGQNYLLLPNNIMMFSSYSNITFEGSFNSIFVYKIQNFTIKGNGNQGKICGTIKNIEGNKNNFITQLDVENILGDSNSGFFGNITKVQGKNNDLTVHSLNELNGERNEIRIKPNRYGLQTPITLIHGNYNVIHGNCTKVSGSYNFITGSCEIVEGLENKINNIVRANLSGNNSFQFTANRQNELDIVDIPNPPLLIRQSRNRRVEIPDPPLLIRQSRNSLFELTNIFPKTLTIIPDPFEESKAEEEQQTCLICMENKPSVCITDCGHSSFCGNCIQTIFLQNKKLVCPLCKQTATKVIRFFL